MFHFRAVLCCVSLNLNEMKFLVENHRKYVCIAGILLSLYAYFIELMVEMNGSYNPYCEITARMNCTAAFASK